MPVESKDVEKINKWVSERDMWERTKADFNTAERYSIRAIQKGQITAEIVNKKGENVFISAVATQVVNGITARINQLNNLISGAGVTP